MFTVAERSHWARRHHARVCTCLTCLVSAGNSIHHEVTGTHFLILCFCSFASDLHLLMLDYLNTHFLRECKTTAKHVFVCFRHNTECLEFLFFKSVSILAFARALFCPGQKWRHQDDDPCHTLRTSAVKRAFFSTGKGFLFFFVSVWCSIILKHTQKIFRQMLLSTYDCIKTFKCGPPHVQPLQ